MGSTIELSCPVCKRTTITFERIVGPAEPAAKFNEQVSVLNAAVKREAAEIRDKKFEETRPTNVDDAAVAWISETADRSAEEIYKAGQLDNLKKKHASKRAALIDRYRGVIGEVAVTYCRSCGHVLGTTVSPLRLEEALGRILVSMQALTEAVTASQLELATALTALNEKLASHEARESRRELNETIDQFEEAVEDMLNQEE